MPNEVVHARVLLEAARYAGAYVPDVGDGAVVPYGAPELLLVQVTYVVIDVFGRDVEG